MRVASRCICTITASLTRPCCACIFCCWVWSSFSFAASVAWSLSFKAFIAALPHLPILEEAITACICTYATVAPAGNTGGGGAGVAAGFGAGVWPVAGGVVGGGVVCCAVGRDPT